MSLQEKLRAKKAQLSHTQTRQVIEKLLLTNFYEILTFRVRTADGKVYTEDLNEATISECEASNFGFVVDNEPDLQMAEVIPGKLFLGSQVMK